jgi:hypothetical protein
VLRGDRWRIVGRRGGLFGAADRLRAWLGGSIAEGLRGERRALLQGVVLGDEQGLSRSLRDDFRASGLYTCGPSWVPTDRLPRHHDRPRHVALLSAHPVAIWERGAHARRAPALLFGAVEGVTVYDPGRVRCGIVTFAVEGVAAEEMKQLLALERSTRPSPRRALR